MRKNRILLFLLTASLMLGLAAPALASIFDFQVTIKLTPVKLYVGDQVKATVTVTTFSNDEEAQNQNYYYTYEWFPYGYTKPITSNNHTEPEDAMNIWVLGKGRVRVTVTETTLGTYSQTAQAEFEVIGTRPLGELTLSTRDAVVGDTIIGTVSDVEGGTPPYTYSYLWQVESGNVTKDYPGAQNTSSLTDKFLVPEGKHGYLSCVITDAKGLKGSAGYGKQPNLPIDFSITVPAPLVLEAFLGDDGEPRLYQVRGEKTTCFAGHVGGKPPYKASFVWNDVDNSGKTNITNQSSTGNYDGYLWAEHIIPLNTKSGFVDVTLSDALGQVRKQRVDYNLANPLKASASLTPPQAISQQTITATVTVSGGVMPYEYIYSWADQPAVHSDLNTNTMNVPLIHSEQIISDVLIQIYDQSGQYQKITLPFRMMPYAINLSLSATSVQAGQALSATAEALGGNGPYTYEFKYAIKDGDKLFILHNPKGRSADSSISLTIPFGQSGYVQVDCYDKDGTGHAYVTKNFAITGSPANPLILSGASLNKTAFKAGETVRVSATASGGTPPYSTEVGYTWNLSKYGKVVLATASGLSVSFSAPEGQTGSIKHVTVTDAKGRIAVIYPNLPFTIEPKEVKRGDSDGNGIISHADLLQMANYLTIKRWPDFFYNADVNGDSDINLHDLIILIGQLVGD